MRWAWGPVPRAISAGTLRTHGAPASLPLLRERLVLLRGLPARRELYLHSVCREGPLRHSAPPHQSASRFVEGSRPADPRGGRTPPPSLPQGPRVVGNRRNAGTHTSAPAGTAPGRGSQRAPEPQGRGRSRSSGRVEASKSTTCLIRRPCRSPPTRRGIERSWMGSHSG